MRKCKCGRSVPISPDQRKRIRSFKTTYPWVSQKDLASLLGCSQMRVSEIVRSLAAKGGL